MLRINEAQRRLIQEAETSGALTIPSFLVEKDLILNQILDSISDVDCESFSLRFGGGTSLSKVYGYWNRMSEDLDFSITPVGSKVTGGRTSRRKLREAIVSGLEPLAGEKVEADSHSESRFTSISIPYANYFSPLAPVSPRVLIDLWFEREQREFELRKVASWVDFIPGVRVTPGVLKIHAVPLAQTVGNKFSTIIRRGSSLLEQPKLLRHVFDIFQVAKDLDPEQIATATMGALQEEEKRHRGKDLSIPKTVGELGNRLLEVSLSPGAKALYNDWVEPMVVEGFEVDSVFEGFNEQVSLLLDAIDELGLRSISER